MIICDRNKCVGCGACANICSTNCINMAYDADGFLYPQVSLSCINCGRCKKVCPALIDTNAETPISAFLGRSKDENVLRQSTSGGIFTEITNLIIKNNGDVCAAKLNDDLSVSHSFVTKETDLKDFRGSKYIQSETKNTFLKIKELLGKGIEVVFFGTPCQVAGLKAFLHKEYPNLLTVDFICHGVASQKVYFEHINLFGICDKENVTSMFRNKKDGYVNSKLKTLSTVDGFFHSKKVIESSFVFAYSNNLLSRPSCGACKYACEKRVSDITIADYMNDDITYYERENGVSLILCNTQKGYNTVKQLDNVEMREIILQKVLNESMHLNYPPQPHQNRDMFFKYMHKHGYTSSANKYFCVYGISKKKMYLAKIKHLLKIALKK